MKQYTMRLQRSILLMICINALSGCNTMAHMAWKAAFHTDSSPFKKSEHRRRIERQRKHIDGLWKDGYGFNNPNADRLRNGEEPQSFYE